jgi:hypothetical protein
MMVIMVVMMMMMTNLRNEDEIGLSEVNNLLLKRLYY